jgi:serine/threonine protein phosphatase PrpC
MLWRRIERFARSVDAPSAMKAGDGYCLGSTLGTIRKENQDRVIIVEASYPNEPSRSTVLAVLADGMGGLSHGGDAATVGLSVFVTRFLRTPRLNPIDRLRAAALSANNAVYSMFDGRSGTTLSAVMLDHGGQAVGVNVGDSRIYSLASNASPVQLSQDDTLAGVMGDKAKGHEAQRLVQFIGMGEGVEPHIISMPKFAEATSVLLTTDGAHGSSKDAFVQCARSSSSPYALIDGLLHLNKLTGGRDNGTAIVLSPKNERALIEGEQGLSLTLVSPFRYLEIWIPLLGFDLAHNRNREPSIQTPSSTPERPEGTPQAQVPSEHLDRKAKGDPKKNSRSRKRKTTAQREPNASLPLEDEVSPGLDIKFPDTE